MTYTVSSGTLNPTQLNPWLYVLVVGFYISIIVTNLALRLQDFNKLIQTHSFIHSGV